MTRQIQTIAMTGATGFVGKIFTDLAIRQGYKLRALTRREQTDQDGITWIDGALDNTDCLKELCDGADALVHIAGVVKAPDRDGFEAGNVAGTLAVVEAAKAVGISRFVHISSLAAREPDLSEYGRSKERAEKIVATSGLDWTMIRPPAIYGPGDGEMLDLFKMAKRGFVMLPPGGNLSVIHVQDLVRLILALLPPRDDLTAETYEIDDGVPGGWAHVGFGKAIGWAVGKRITAISTPRFLLDIASRMDLLFRGSSAKLTSDRVNYFCHEDWVIDARKRPPEDIWQPNIGTRAGLKETAKWYHENSWL